jgi:hypothetical protein
MYHPAPRVPLFRAEPARKQVVFIHKPVVFNQLSGPECIKYGLFHPAVGRPVTIHFLGASDFTRFQFIENDFPCTHNNVCLIFLIKRSIFFHISHNKSGHDQAQLLYPAYGRHISAFRANQAFSVSPIKYALWA